MSKPILYTFSGSVWAAVPELLIADLYPQDAIESKVVNLVDGENFHPSFIKLNPKATLPTLEADGKVYTSTADVTAYLLKHSPVSVKAGTDFIQTIHEDNLDPNFAFLMATDEETFIAKARGLVMKFLSNRQAALEKHFSTSEGAPHQEFYQSKLQANGGLLAVYQGKVPETGKQAFFQSSQDHLKRINSFVIETLPSFLPKSGEGPFMGGDRPGEDDFHLAAWLTRIGSAFGATGPGDVTKAMENAFGKPVSEKVAQYWATWTERPSWKAVYAAGLH
ncbi:hypothetical protein K435DRAFT_829212 [Dendrothele bispora CBS 962.96]|uniref:GST N-terminal domain-containing protein n=1 Tax=Dendrothele bispora (strain CBS 962.96) TaxID=1314807 RepID=A0A4S8LZU8_DENBC|nr:hypothetical protein K435DRAFT_829212 [Dendrothele bispora CBS 962.96]